MERSASGRPRGPEGVSGTNELDTRLSSYLVVSAAITDRELGYPVRVLFSTRTARALVASEAVWQALASDNWRELPTTQIEMLRSAEILVQRSARELENIVEENRTEIASARQLFQVVQPTAACQLGCGYCGQEHSSKKMSSEDQQRLLDRLRKRLQSSQYDELSIGWFGAEPLLGLSVMRELSPRLQELAREHDVAYRAKIVTNGVLLTADVARELCTEHAVQEAEVTLDGPRLVHDARRVTKKGRPTFDQIFGNLCTLRDRADIPLRVVVRCNVDQRNYRHIPELIDAIADAQLHQLISFYFSPVYSWGNDADVESLSATEYAGWEIEWFAQMHRRGFRVALLPGRRKVVCLAVQKDGELTDAYGTVFSCTEVSYVPAYGQPNRYAIVDGAPAPFRDFNQEILDGQHSSCRQCRLLPVCGGSCPKLWAEGKTPCPSMKANLQDRLVLWYAIQKSRGRQVPVSGEMVL